MKRKQTLAETQNQLFGSIRSLAEHLIADAYARYNPEKGTFATTSALPRKLKQGLTSDKTAKEAYTKKTVAALSVSGGTPGQQFSEADCLIYTKAKQNFLTALRAYAEAVVYDAYSRYDPDDDGEFFTREAYEELMEALADDEVIPMEEIAEELGIKW